MTDDPRPFPDLPATELPLAEPLPAEPLPAEPLPAEPLPAEPLPAEPWPLNKPSLGPTTASERLANIDFVRGVALLGILLVNAAIFFGPLAALISPGQATPSGPADALATFLVLVLCQGKFVGLFSLLFGYGLLRQMERADAAGRSALGLTVRRLGLLALFGLAHALVLWYGDILFFYACLGAWLLLARHARARSLVITAVALLAFGLALQVGFIGLAVLFGAGRNPDAPPPGVQVPEGWPPALQGMAAGRFDPASPAWIDAETRAYRDGPWSDAQIFRTASWLAFLLISLFSFSWQLLGMMFLGGLLWRLRFFDPDRRPLRLRVLRIALPVGLALEVAAGVFFWSRPRQPEPAWAAGQVLQILGTLVLPLGYLAGLALLADWLPERLRRPVCSAGRMSLTVYLLETVLATALAYHWGLRLFGRVSAWQQAALAVAIWLVLVVFSQAWLTRFAQGPLEWLWRRLEYGRAA